MWTVNELMTGKCGRWRHQVTTHLDKISGIAGKKASDPIPNLCSIYAGFIYCEQIMIK